MLDLNILIMLFIITKYQKAIELLEKIRNYQDLELVDMYIERLGSLIDSTNVESP